MGLTIHYTFLRDKTPEYLLKKVEIVAIRLGFKIEERGYNKLILNPHKGSEWIELHFHKAKKILQREGLNFEKEKLKRGDFGKVYPADWICSGFTKTHYAGYENHVKVAEFLRIVASYCRKSEVYDESGYYEEGFSPEAVKKLKDFLGDYNKMLGKLGNQLKEAFGGEVILGKDLK